MGSGKLLFAFFAAMAEAERENIRESTLEGLDTASRKGKHGGRPPVITDDVLHTSRRRTPTSLTSRPVNSPAFVRRPSPLADVVRRQWLPLVPVPILPRARR